MSLLRLFGFIFWFQSFVIYINFTEAPNRFFEDLNPKRATRIFAYYMKEKSTNETDICSPMIYKDNAILRYINADQICYSAMHHEFILKKIQKQNSFKDAECVKKNVILNKGQTRLAQVAKCYCLQKGKDDYFYVATTRSEYHQYAILEAVEKKPENQQGKDRLKVVAILVLGWGPRQFSEMEEYLKTIYFPPVQETTDPQTALELSLLRGANADENVNMEHVCKPLNDGDNFLMLNYINGNKACYMALKHPFIKEQKRYLLPSKKYKKSSCLIRQIELILENIPDREILKSVSICHCMNKNTGAEDYFYIGHTNKKYHYAIFEMIKTKRVEGSKTSIKATAILNLEHTLHDLEEITNYFNKNFVPIGAVTTVAKEATQMFVVRRPIHELATNHICNYRIEFQGFPNVTRDSIICYLALGHPFVNDTLNCPRLEQPHHVECETIPISLSNAGHDFSEMEWAASCVCDDMENPRKVFIANTNIENHYAVITRMKGRENLLTRKVVANLKLEPSQDDIERMKDYFNHPTVYGF